MSEVTLPPVRIDLLDPRTGKISTDWYRFFQQTFVRIGGPTYSISVTGDGLNYDGATGEFAINSTPNNTPSTIVYRDASGNFSAGTITASLSGNASTASKWAIARTLSLSGDATGTNSVDGSGDADTALTLASTGVPAGTYGSATRTPVYTVDAKGRLTGSTDALITPAFSSLTGKPTTATGYGILSIDNIPIGSATPSTGAFTKATFPAIATPSAPTAGTVNLYGSAAPSGVTRMVMQTSTGAELAFFRDSVLTVRNNSGSTINKGQMVYITGSNGVVPTIGLAKADSAATTRMVGMALANIANNAYGTIQTGGEIRGINTSAFSDGDIIWLSAATAGAVTAAEPTSPNLAMRVGTVVLSNASGIIQLFIQPAVINWGAPPAIGNGTPAAGTFTTLTATGLADLSAAGAGQVKFPASPNLSANANTLDAYAEGTWTPGITFGGAAVGLTYTTQTAVYTRIGNRVLFSGRIQLSNKGASVGAALITGLPFTTNAGAGMNGAFSIQMNNVAAALTAPFGSILPGVTTLLLSQLVAGTNTQLVDTDFTNTTVINFSGHYSV